MKTKIWGWVRCDRCGGDLPAVGGDNDHPDLPHDLPYGGDCPGHVGDDGLCGAYDGWGAADIRAHMKARGYVEGD
jgi:hypothetical protein